MHTRNLETDFVVVGGGLAGVCAALAASRNGARVVLIQDRSVLGGNASSEVKMHVVGADCHGSRPGARESGLIEELKLEDAARNPHRSYAHWDLLLYEKVAAEPRITLLLDTQCTGCDVDESGGTRRITAVKATRNPTEENFIIRAPFFADCSGDGRLGAEAGAAFTSGREAKSDYQESLALEVADKQTLGNSILFTARKHDTPQPFLRPFWARPFTQEEFKHRPIKSYEYGYWWSEWGGDLDTIRDMPAIRHELFRIVLGIWDYIKNSGEHPDSSHWALDWVGMIPGKRESRRLLGPCVLTQADVESGRIFEDQIAYGGWWLDLHPPTGIDAIEEEPCQQIHFPHLFSIPLRCVYSRNVANLFFAGRNISATHVAFASTRVMGTCAVLGQAIGTAAAIALSDPTRSIAEIFDAKQIKQLQQDLLRNDAFLLNQVNQEDTDLARRAAITTSSHQPESTGLAVIDGITRELPTHLGPWADGKNHRWESVGLPASIDLAWKNQISIAEVHLTFDSGLQRELILSPSDSTTRKTVRGPQPELVRDYEVLLDGKVIETVSGNYLRKRIHRLPTLIAANRLSVRVLATQGTPNARLFEIRVYSSPFGGASSSHSAQA